MFLWLIVPVVSLVFFFQNKPHLRIGNLALEGRVQKLSKPLVVCKTIRTPKVNATHPSPISPSSPSSSDAMVDHKQSDSHMQVHGVVRRKYIFKTRPNPIISSAEPDSSA